MSAFLEKVRKLAEDVTTREGCSLWDLEFVGAGAGRALRVYIEKPAVDGGVSVNDCANVSRGLNEFLDAQEEEVVPGGAYTLEVSSPGLERVLKQKWHFEQCLNKKIYIKTFAPLLELNPEVPELGKAKQLSGELAQVSETGIEMKLEEKLVKVPFEQITKSHTVFEFETAADKNPKNKHKQKNKKPKNN